MWCAGHHHWQATMLATSRSTLQSHYHPYTTPNLTNHLHLQALIFDTSGKDNLIQLLTTPYLYNRIEKPGYNTVKHTCSDREIQAGQLK